MTAMEVMTKFSLNKKTLYKMAERLNIPKEKGKYVFPDDFKPLFIPDGREYRPYKESALLPYIYLMDAISKLWVVEDNYMGVDEKVRRTVIRELKKAGLITLKDGIDENSLNYEDYIVSLHNDDWLKQKNSEKKTIINNVIFAITAGAAYGLTKSMI